jgi:hypothetical protein
VALTTPAPGALTGDSTPSFAGVAGTDTGDSTAVTVRVYAGSTVGGTPLQTLTATRDAAGAFAVDAAQPLADGTYTAQAEQLDAAGNTGRSTAATFAVDSTAPAVTLTAPTNGSTSSDTTPTLAGTAGTASGDASLVTVRLYAGTTPTGSPIQSPFATRAADGSYSVDATPLAAGTYTAQAEQADATGNLGRSAPSTFSVVPTAPTVTLTSPANGSITTDSTPSFAGTAGTSPGDSDTVTVNVYVGPTVAGSPVQTLTAPRAPNGAYDIEPAPLADGTYTVRAEQSNGEGIVGRSAPATFTVDATPPPTPTLDSGPPDPSTVSTATFSFSSSEAGVAFQCRLDGQAFSGCTSPQSYAAVADGTHTFEVKARDAAGNESASAAYGWLVDAPPRVTLVTPANGSSTADTTPMFSGQAAVDPGDSLTVQVKVFTGATLVQTLTSIRDLSGAFAVEATAPLTDGTYMAQAEQSDLTGTGTSPANTFTVDTTPPVPPTIASAPTDPSSSATASFAFSAEAGAQLLCRIDAQPFAACSSPKSYSGLVEGQHTFEVKARDAAANESAAAARAWTVDLTAPSPSLTSPATGSSTSDTTPALSGVAGTAVGDAASVTVSLYAGATASGTPAQVRTATAGTGGAYSVDALPLAPGTYTAQTAQSDLAGNVGRSAPTTFAVTGSTAGYRATVMADAPRGYWRLGESGGTAAADETSNASNGSYLGGPTLGVAGALATDPNTAVTFDGANDNASMGDPANGVLDFGAGDFSLELWLRTAVNAEQAVLSKAGATGPSWLITVSDDPGAVGGIRVRIADGTVTRYAYSTSRVDDNRWHHVVVAVDRDAGTSIQIDGAAPQFAAGAAAGSISNAGSLIVGGGAGYPFFRGDVDEVAVYAGLLSSARATAHYDAARGGPSAPVVTLTTPAQGSSTSDTTPTFSGTASTQPGHSTTVTVKIYAGASASGTPVQTLTTTRAANGSYAVDSSPLAVGQYTARSEQTDGGALVGFSSANTFTVTAPSAAVTMTQPANGSSVQDATPTFVGQARSGTGDPLPVTVRIYSGTTVGGTPVRTAVATRDSNGAWAVDSSPPLAAGTFTGQATQGADVSAATTFTIVDPPPFPGTDPETLSAGDIAGCDTSGDEATALLLDQYPGAVVTTLGDHTYENGALSEFQNCYEPSWGRAKSRTRPAVGDHEYNTTNATGYYTYFNPQLSAFGASATDSTKGYYSYDLGSWHVVALNSNCSRVGGCGAGSAQEQWLRTDLALHPAACTLAVIHHPRFSSGGNHGNIAEMQAFWQALYDGGAEVVLSGNDHDYERFAPQTATGLLDVGRGLSQFVVGTGGRSFYLFANGTLKANSEVRRDDTFGVLRLKLHTGSYEWEFVPEAGKTFRDFGSRSCH